MDAVENGGASNRANGSIGVKVCKESRLAGELIEVRGLGLWIPVATEPLRVVVFRCDPEDMRPLGSGEAERAEEE